MNRTLGIILIALGLFGLAWGGFTYTTREKVVDIGPIHATREKAHNVPLPPIVGVVALIGGIVLLVAGRKEPSRALRIVGKGSGQQLERFRIRGNAASTSHYR